MHFSNQLKYNIHQLLLLARVHSPTGFLLLFFPCSFVSALYSKNIDELFFTLLITFACSFIIRSAGCIINDIIDRSIDAKVTRTKNRPLASGAVTMTAVLYFLFALLIIQLVILFYLPIKSIISSFTIFPFIILYPALKRFTYLPQIFLGFVFNFGVIVTYYMMDSNLSLSVILLYIGCIFWTVAYDTIYGFMDIKDDDKHNIKSFSLLIKDNNPKVIIGILYSLFIGLVMAAAYLAAGKINLVSILFWIASFVSLIRQLSFDLENPEDCLKHFKANTGTGALIFLALLINNVNIWR